MAMQAVEIGLGCQGQVADIYLPKPWIPTQGKDAAAFLQIKQVPQEFLCQEKVQRYCLELASITIIWSQF